VQNRLNPKPASGRLHTLMAIQVPGDLQFSFGR
jgi:hypothetical protein